MITSQRVYNFKEKKLKEKSRRVLSKRVEFEPKRVIQLKEVGGLTKTTLYGSYEFVIHVPSEYDYRFSSRRYVTIRLHS